MVLNFKFQKVMHALFTYTELLQVMENHNGLFSIKCHVAYLILRIGHHLKSRDFAFLQNLKVKDCKKKFPTPDSSWVGMHVWLG